MPRGLLSVYAFDQVWQISPFIHYGLLALGNRGCASIGITTLKERRFSTSSRSSILDIHPSNLIRRLSGNAAVAAVSNQSRPDQPVVVREPTPLSLVFDGAKPRVFAQKLSIELARSEPLEAAATVLEQIPGPFAFIALTKKGEVLAGRDKTGLKPLTIGNMGFDSGAVVASESTAMDAIGAEYKTQIEPGQIYLITPHSIEKKQTRSEAKTRLCALEYLYLARPDSIMDLGEVCQVRSSLGETLAKEASAIEGSEKVAAIPESSLPQALAYSEQTRLPCVQGFAGNICKVRTLLEKDEATRISATQLKLSPIKSSIKDSRIVLLDNLLVRGITLRCAAQRLRNSGARSIRAAIAGPQITAPCPYSDLIPPPRELICAQLKKPEIEKALGLDGLDWLSVEGLIEALKIPKDQVCMECFIGGGK
jgi:amidophosphoribosyltransferase